MAKEGSAKGTIRDIKRKTRRKYSAEEKTRIVVEGLRGEMTIAALCRKEGGNANFTVLPVHSADAGRSSYSLFCSCTR